MRRTRLSFSNGVLRVTVSVLVVLTSAAQAQLLIPKEVPAEKAPPAPRPAPEVRPSKPAAPSRPAQPAKPAAPPAAAAPVEPAAVILDEFNGSTLGKSNGARYLRAVDGDGMLFSRDSETRVVYPKELFPREGTIELWVWVDKGYSFADFVPHEETGAAALFTTEAGGADVWWPGSSTLKVYGDGRVNWSMSLTKYDNPRQTLEVAGTPFRMRQWHAIGVSFGSEGQWIRVDGEPEAGDPAKTLPLGVGGTHESATDEPTLGEAVSAFWKNNQNESGFEGLVDRFRISSRQKDWVLSAAPVPAVSSEIAAPPSSEAASATPPEAPAAPAEADDPASKLYSEAWDEYQAEHFEQARELFERYLAQFSDGAMREWAEFWVGVSCMKLQQWDEAVPRFERFRKDFPSGEQVPHSMYLQADAHFKLDQPKKGLALLRQLIAEWPDSPPAVQAKSQLEKLGIR